MSHPSAAAWVRAEVWRDTLLDAARRLAPLGIELMAIKGVYFVHALGVGASERPMADADAIVVRGDFDRAVKALVSSGEWLDAHGWSAKVLPRKRGGMLDIHRIPLPPFFGAMHASEMKRRAARHPAFDDLVWVPDALDAGCIATAHYIKDCLGLREGKGNLAQDLDLLVDRAGVTPRGLAERLAHHRLRNVGLVAFTALTEVEQRWQPWVTALDPSSRERLRARATVRVLRRYTGAHPDLAYLLVRSLGDDAGRGLVGFVATAARFGRDRISSP
ncbi:MAG: nucleotidyltransferase family protein [Polyangiaceae bacterium]